MIKYITTTKCTRQCSYCITKNVKVKEAEKLYDILNVLIPCSDLDTEIMITGGEPTLHKHFESIVTTCDMLFKKVYVTSQNPEIFEMELPIDAITFSLHDFKTVPNVIQLCLDIPVYASILDVQYNYHLPQTLKNMGYSGLTINEEQRNGQKFTERLPEVKNFSIKINKRGHCMRDTIILPDLEVINNFERYL